MIPVLTQRNVILAPVLMMLVSAQLACAWYDPGAQRWINRDPVGDIGFIEGAPDGRGSKNSSRDNAYTFVDNAPVRSSDPLGLHVFKGCRQKEQRAIEDALKQECDKAKECAKCTSAGEATTGVDAVCDKSLTFNCVPQDFRFADGSTCKGACGKARPSSNEIFMCPYGLNNGPGCGRPACTVFHESLHIGGLPGKPHPSDFSDFEKCMGCPPKGGL